MLELLLQQLHKLVKDYKWTQDGFHPKMFLEKQRLLHKVTHVIKIDPMYW